MELTGQRWILIRARMPLVVCGHVHEQHGAQILPGASGQASDGTLVINATTMGPTFSPTNAPIVIDVEAPKWRKATEAARL